MLTLPAKTRRKKQPYLSIRSQLPRRNLERQAKLFFMELREFIKTSAIDDMGPGFLRYLTIGADGQLDMEFGYFTNRLHPGGGPFRSGVLPAGLYMTAEWTGPYERLPDIHAMLPGWAAENGVNWQMRQADGETSYGCRLEIFHQSPRHVEDPAQYRTEIAILLDSGKPEAGEAG
jgi:effector-binding domain-containing protein